MPILIDELSIWDISFRWAGYDPRKFYFRIPLEVENHARNLIKAVHEAELACESITLEKREFEKDEVKLSFYYWVDDFFSTTSGRFVSRKLLKWASINRYDFMQWCQRMNAPLPQFWFPQGWNLQYELPENDYYPGLMHDLKHWPEDERKAFFENLEKSETEKADLKTRPSQEATIACQMIAKNLWKSDISISINDMVQRFEIQNLGGANSYQDAVVRKWLSRVAPPEVKARVGRPKKKNTTEDI
jgi:hypothetical protein